jgi:two-component system, cell cycle sensor histidine kinase and response regulator CckA
MSERNILIVEDDVVVAKCLAETLEMLGYRISGTVSTGEEALLSVEYGAPQIVLMDIRLRGILDGVEAARQIRSRFDVPVVYLTGFSDQALLDRAMETEPYGYLVKPIEMKALITTIETTLCKHQADKRLRESEERYRNLFDNAPVGIFQTTVDGRFINVNRAQARMLGYESPEELLASVKDIATDIWAEPEHFKKMVDTLLVRDRVVNVKADFHRREGSALIGSLHSQVVRNDDGSVRCIEGFFEDITARKKAEDERELLRTQLLQAQKMEAIGTLTGGIAHDFNNLLTIMNGFAEILLTDTSEDDPRHGNLQKILETGRKGADLVQKLQVFSKEAEIRLQPVNLNHNVKNVVDLVKRTFPKTIEIETICSDELCIVNADTAQAEQVLMNLCINAKEAMPEGGQLRIETRNIVFDDDYCRLRSGAKAGRHVLIAISDTGIGMSKETMDRIFDPFFTTKGWDFKKGTGLGLSLAKGIMDQHGGWITCESEQGKGTTFRLYFSHIAESTVDPKLEPLAETVLERKKVLLVEDEVYVRELANVFLSV